MIVTLFKTTLKKNWVLWTIFLGVLTMYLGVMIMIFDPQNMDAIMNLIEVFPEDMMKAFGFSAAATDLTAYLASWLYGMLMFAFPMVYSIILSNRLVAKKVDNGSFAYLLSTPHSRSSIIITQGVYVLVSIAALFAAVFGLGVLIGEMVYPGLLDIPAFFRLNVTAMLVNMAVTMIAFFFSCLFNSTKWSLGFGAGVPIAFLLMHMLGGASANTAFLKDASIYGFFDPVSVVRGASTWGVNLIYMAIAAVLFIGGVLLFKRKNLPL